MLAPAASWPNAMEYLEDERLSKRGVTFRIVECRDSLQLLVDFLFKNCSNKALHILQRVGRVAANKQYFPKVSLLTLSLVVRVKSFAHKEISAFGTLKMKGVKESFFTHILDV